MCSPTLKAKHKLYTFQSGKCYYCQVQMLPVSYKIIKGMTIPSSVATFDHIILKSNGGLDTIKNGVCACYECNQLRGQYEFVWFSSMVFDTTSKKRFTQTIATLRKAEKICNITMKKELPPPVVPPKKPAKIKPPKAHYYNSNHGRSLALMEKQDGHCKTCKIDLLPVLYLRDMKEGEVKHHYCTHLQRPMLTVTGSTKKKRKLICKKCHLKLKG